MPSAPSAIPVPPSERPLRILFLHGYTSTPLLFRHKSAALVKALSKSLANYSIQCSYPGGPHLLDPSDIPGYEGSMDTGASEASEARGWWQRRDYPVTGKGGGGQGEDEVEVVYEGLEEGLAEIAKCVREEGPFDGVVGFSQGACAAAMLASLLEHGRRQAFDRLEKDGGLMYPRAFDRLHDCGQRELKFVVTYGGFRAPGKRYAAFYAPKIRTPVLHVLGAVDVVVEEERSRKLVDACERGEERVVVHPGGHFVPSQRPWLNAVVGFIRGCLDDDDDDGGGVKGEKGGKEKEERVEDMEVPF